MISRRSMIAALLASAAALAAPTAKAGEFLKMATLGPGSSSYMVMSTFAQIVNDALPDVDIQVNATGAATAHAIQTAQGQLDLFMMAPIVHRFMSEGTAMFANIPQAPDMAKDLRSILIFPLGYYHIVTWADSGIDDLTDLKGKSVFIGPPGGSAAVTMKQLIEGATGMTADKDFTAVSVGWDAGLQAFQDGRVDVYANPTLPPSPVIEQLALTRDIRLLGLTEDQLAQPDVKNLVDRPGGATQVIPAGTYGEHQANETDVTTVASYVGIGTNKNLSDDLVYEITKAFWTSAEEKRTSTPWLRNVTLEGAFHDLNMPLHPGALRYYEEIGLDIPDNLKPAG